ncbi:MAG TPA: hypothetical protein VHP58_00535 [Alphaproteobacteria bacterium]|nr:hypothetical protein [Alphaproteobacteria bacterium]
MAIFFAGAFFTALGFGFAEAFALVAFLGAGFWGFALAMGPNLPAPTSNRKYGIIRVPKRAINKQPRTKSVQPTDSGASLPHAFSVKRPPYILYVSAARRVDQTAPKRYP